MASEGSETEGEPNPSAADTSAVDTMESETASHTDEDQVTEDDVDTPDANQVTEDGVDTPDDKEESTSTGFNDEAKDSDFNISENDSRSSSNNVAIRSVAKRGRKRNSADANLDAAPQRATPRRAARNVKRYTDDDAFTELDEIRGSDPDYNMSDSDDDPDFDPHKKKEMSPEPDIRTRRGRGGAKSKRSRSVRRSIETALDGFSSNAARKKTVNEAIKIEPTGQTEDSAADSNRLNNSATDGENKTKEISDNTVSSTDDATKTAGKLSSAYNYAATRTRQNQAIRLPEGPNLTEEQLKLIESQFKSGDFVMAKKDTDIMENPPIWRIDGKSLLQKFQAFEKDGKTLYRNISTYSGWTSQAKALYIPVKVNFVFQSRYDTVVELIGFKGADGEDDEPTQVVDKPVWIPKTKDFEISDDMRGHMPSFEIYLQTLISQALDNNFLQEIYEEKDSYFVDRVEVLDGLTDSRKEKILKLAKWDTKFQTSLDTWPCVNTMITKNTGKCQACNTNDAKMLSQFYGQPYDHKTLRSREPSIWDLDHKNFETCDPCSLLSQLYNKVAHQKYDYYSQCKSTVTNMRVSHPNKSTTNVLRDLLANDDWITGLFRAMCATWSKIDNYKDESKSKEDSKSEEQSKSDDSSAPTATSSTTSALRGIKVNASAEEEDPDDPTPEQEDK